MAHKPKQCKHCGKDYFPAQVSGKDHRRNFAGCGVSARLAAAGIFPRARLYCSDLCRQLAFRARNVAARDKPGYSSRVAKPDGDLFAASPSANASRRLAIEQGALVVRRGFGLPGEPVQVACGRRGCGKRVAWSRGRPPKYCSAFCRVKAFRQRKAADEFHEAKRK